MTEPAFTLESPAAPPEATADTRAIDRALPWVLGLITLAVGVSIVDSLPVGVMHDDGMYVILAKSLATGHGYRWLNLPGTPPATHFPPGYPLVLALLWRLFPSFPANVLGFKLANACFTSVSAFLMVRFTRERWQVGPVAAAALSAFAMLGIPILALSSMVMSEPLFLMLVLIALSIAERVVDGSDRRLWVLVGLGLLVGATTLVRTHGVALIAAIPAMLLLRRRGREALAFVAAAVAVVLPWQLWAAAHTGGLPDPMGGNYESYGRWLALGVRADGAILFWRTLVRTIPQIDSMLATLAAPSMPWAVRHIVLGAFSVLWLLGVRPLVRRAPVTAIFLALYLAIVILWPFPPSRFLWCVWPLVLLPVMLGIRALFLWRPPAIAPRVTRLFLLAAAAALLAGHVRYTVRGYGGRWWSSVARMNAALLRPVVLWASQRTPPNAVLGVEEESTVYLYTGRKAVPIQTFTVNQFFARRTPAQDADVMRAILARYAVDAIAVSSAPMRAAAHVLATSNPPQLAVRDTFPENLVLVPLHR